MTRACTRAFVGLGSNLYDPVRQLQLALQSLAAVPRTRVVAVSGFYANPPMGPSQPDYVNAVASLTTALSPHALLSELHTIEFCRGRRRAGERWGPRVLDLDLLLMGDVQVDDERLTLPHPGLGERGFVLLPLAELEPQLELADGRTVAALLERVALDDLTRLDVAALDVTSPESPRA